MSRERLVFKSRATKNWPQKPLSLKGFTLLYTTVYSGL